MIMSNFLVLMRALNRLLMKTVCLLKVERGLLLLRQPPALPEREPTLIHE